MDDELKKAAYLGCIDAKQDGNVPDDERNKWTPLHYAVDHNHVKVVQFLLKNGADPLASARGGWTPLHAARAGGYLKIEHILIKAIKDSGRELPYPPECPRTPPTRTLLACGCFSNAPSRAC